MNDRLRQQAAVDRLLAGLSSENFTSAKILDRERELYRALSKVSNGAPWKYVPISPYAEPANLDELVGDMFRGASMEMQLHASRLDALYSRLASSRNALQAELEIAEVSASEAYELLSELSLEVTNDADQFVWVTESFNSFSGIDRNATTALVDTDFGVATLPAVSSTPLSDFEVTFLKDSSKGIPGANSLIVDVGRPPTPEAPPEPKLESPEVANFSRVFDGDPGSYFEFERVFVEPQQKVTRAGRAFVHNPSGKSEDVVKITRDYDWRLYIGWPGEDGLDYGPENKGIPWAEFKKAESTPVDDNRSAISLSARSPDSAVLSFDVSFNPPTEISTIRILPFLRHGQPLFIDQIVIHSGDIQIPLAVQRVLGGRDLRTESSSVPVPDGSPQSSGALLRVPTDRAVDRISFQFSSPPVETRFGVAHPYREDLVERRSVRKFLFVSSVDRQKEWSRKPTTQEPRYIRSETKQPKILGSTADLATAAAIAVALQGVFSALAAQQTAKAGASATVAGAAAVTPGMQGVQAAATVATLGSAASALKLGKVATLLGKAAPVIGGVMVASEILKAGFGFKRTFTLLKSESGFDIFKAARAAVGLRSLDFSRDVYASEAVVTTGRKIFSRPVSKIGLVAEDFTPPEWGPGDWISYFISTDGANWTPMVKMTETTLDKSFTPPSPTNQVFIRAVIRGNPSDPMSRPEIRHIALQGLPVQP